MGQTTLTHAVTPKPPCLTKSKFLWGTQCQKLLWHAFNAPNQLPDTSATQQAIFDQGHEVGALAKQLYPEGIDLGAEDNGFQQALAASLAAVKQRKPMFEVGFVYNGAYARADILNPVGQDAWDIIEVKSSTSVKDVNLVDLAFQAFVYNGSGLNIRRCYIMHVNSDYVRRGAIDPKKFFKPVDVTTQVSTLSREIETRADDMFSVIRRKLSPEIKIGPHCGDPYDCPLMDLCWAFLPEQNVTTLYRAGKKAFTLINDGVLAVKDIPATFKLTENQQLQHAAVLSGKPYVDRPALAAFLGQLKYPLSFLDFETFSTAIPMFNEVCPYQQVPFQYSLHVVNAPGAKPEHYSFLADGRNDSRPAFMRQLKADLPETGSVIVYNASFEQGRLKECSELLPEFKSWKQKVDRRVVDLLLPFRGFRYYHPSQEGSASMKAVLPALTGRSYDELEIKEGGTASMEYMRVTFSDVPDAERRKVRAALEKYCGLDTEGMAWIVAELRKLVSHG